jgi:hypothetical protein
MVGFQHLVVPAIYRSGTMGTLDNFVKGCSIVKFCPKQSISMYGCSYIRSDTHTMDKFELNRISRRILDMKKEMFEAVDNEKYERAAVLLIEIKRQQKSMLKKLVR